MLYYIICGALLVGSSESDKDYRSDYEYSSKTDSFYKLHTEGVDYMTALAICKVEGAKLLMPTHEDIVHAHGMLKQYPDIGEQIWAGEGPGDMSSDENEHVTPLSIRDELTCETITRDGDVEKLDCLYTYPYICKVEAKHALFDTQCQVYSTGYSYLENVGSCYKISSIALAWNQAYDECQAEGAHLLVLNSELEYQTVHNLTHYAPKILNSAHNPRYYMAGVRAERTRDGSPVVFKTIFGQTLAEAGFDEWSPGEPNNIYGNELCGSIFINDGKYNDLDCIHLFPFICERNMRVVE